MLGESTLPPQRRQRSRPVIPRAWRFDDDTWTRSEGDGDVLAVAGAAAAQTPETVQPAHDNLEPGTRTDDLGITIGIPVEHPGRRYPASHEFPTGPEIGERLPTFTLPNQQGRAHRLSRRSGRLEIDCGVLSLGGVVTVLPHAAGRAARQPGPLRGRRHPRLRHQLRPPGPAPGLRRAVRRTYDLLSDVDSAVIREFGILNTLVSPDDPEQAAGRSFHGVPFPGVYVTDEHGVVTEKFFHRHYATRESAGSIRDSALGEILARHEVPAVELGTDQVRISAFLSDTSLKFETQSTNLRAVRARRGPAHVWPAAAPTGTSPRGPPYRTRPGCEWGPRDTRRPTLGSSRSWGSRSTSTRGLSTSRFRRRRIPSCSTPGARTSRRS